MNVMIIGSGGREHALAWKAAQSPRVEKVFVVPGNAGTALEKNVENVALDISDFEALVAFAREQYVGLTIVGPEAPLVDGIVDYFEGEEMRCFGPSAAAAQLEGSKAFAKEFMERHNIPTAGYGVFTDRDEAFEYIAEQSFPLVVKADGLAAGKGVIIAQDESEAQAAVTDMLEQNRFGDAGSRVVIEEFLEGEEASFIVIADGKRAMAFATSQDHKAVGDGDTGANTGGMGAYSPAPVVTEKVSKDIMAQVIMPTIRGMQEDGNPFTGFLYAGLMITNRGPRVLEYNVRFGDPETQPILMRLQSDIVALCDLAVDGQLNRGQATWENKPCIGVVMAAGGYPESYAKGDVISGLDAVDEDVKVFHAGTTMDGEDIVTAGGRVLCVCVMGDDLPDAHAKVYDAVSKIHFDNAYWRTDIAHKALNR